MRATDPAGNSDPTPASRTFTVDTSPPDTTITAGPTGPTNDETPTFSFEADQAGSASECRIDEDAFAACTSPYIAPPLADGPHTFDVRATDPAGNTDPTPASRTFTVDTVPPTLAITPVSCTRGRGGEWALMVGDPGGDAAALEVTATSSGQRLVPNANLRLSGTGGTRTLLIRPAAHRSGRAVVTVTVSDGATDTTLEIGVRVGTAGDDVLILDGLGMAVGARGADALFGSRHADLLCGGGGADRLGGGRGDDLLSGGRGGDSLLGQRGGDQLRGGRGPDHFNGGSGRDTLLDFNRRQGDTRS